MTCAFEVCPPCTSSLDHCVPVIFRIYSWVVVVGEPFKNKITLRLAALSTRETVSLLHSSTTCKSETREFFSQPKASRRI